MSKADGDEVLIKARVPEGTPEEDIEIYLTDNYGAPTYKLPWELITAPQEAEPNEEISMSVTDKYGDLRCVRDEKAEQPVKCIYCYANKVTAEKLASDLVVAVKECNRLKQQLSATHDERREE